MHLQVLRTLVPAAVLALCPLAATTDAQGTLVPFRTVLYEDNKVIEETDVGTVTFGQKVEESLFPAAAVQL